MKSNLRCDFEWVNITDDIIFIRDANLGRMSVTNDAEEVYRWINKVVYPGRRVVYQDSDGEWSEIMSVAGGRPTEWRIVYKPWHGLEWDILSRKV